MMDKAHLQEKESRKSAQMLIKSKFSPRPFACLEPEHESLDGRMRFDHNLGDFNHSSRQILQPKLVLGPPDDKYETEADQMAEQVMSTISSSDRVSFQRECGECDEEKEDNKLRRKPAGSGASPAVMSANIEPDLASAIQQYRGHGQPLSEDVRRPMERAFGAEFADVRVHTGTRADSLNRSLQARAFTTGQDIFLRQGEYRPGSSEGQRLLAHELTHVVQQAGNAFPSLQREIFGSGTDIQFDSLPVCPPMARVLGCFPDDAIAEALYGDATIPINYIQRSNYIIEINYNLLLQQWKPYFAESIGFRREGPSLGEEIGEAIRLEETLSVEGDPSYHSSYIENAIPAVGIQVLGGPFLLYPRIVEGRGADGIVLQRRSVHLSEDPLRSSAGALNHVYRSRTSALRALSGLGIERMYTYFIEGGYIYPTIISDTTAPGICAALRRAIEFERIEARAARDLHINLLLWYIGARIPLGTRTGTRAPASVTAESARVLVGPLGRLTAAEIEQAIAASSGRTITLYTKLTQTPTAGRALYFSTERALAEAARSEGQIFVVRVPDVLFFRMESIGVIQRGTTLMRDVVGPEISVHSSASEIILRFLVH